MYRLNMLMSSKTNFGLKSIKHLLRGHPDVLRFDSTANSDNINNATKHNIMIKLEEIQ